MTPAVPGARSPVWRRLGWLWLVVLVTAGCSPAEDPVSRPAAELPGEAAPVPAPAGPRIVFLGDSLTAGYGLTPAEAYPALVERRLRERGLDFAVVNAGVSGDTTAGGLRRLEWSLQGDVRVLVIALGGNDGLRGLPPAELERNLAAMIERARGRGVQVLLAGMEAPPNFGPDYTSEFRAVYAELAAEYGIRLIPFFLEGVAGVPALNLPDGIHPNAAGQERVADLVWRELETMLAPAATQ